VCLAQVELVGSVSGETQNGPVDIAQIERTSDGLRIVDLFGNVTELDGEIQSIDFMTSVVTVGKRHSAERPDPQS